MAALLCTPGCGTGTDAAVRADRAAVGAGSESAAVYVELTNTGGADDALVDARCNCAEDAELHATRDLGGGATMMTAADRIVIPAGTTVELRPGAAHIMLDGLHEPLEGGSSVSVELEFDTSGRIELEVPVVALETLAERAQP